MRFLHSADWQIGKVFKQFGAKEEALRQARLRAIERLGQLAVSNDARHVLVAGDVYDSETPSHITLRAPIERMKAFSEVHWHLLPGNHDPHRPEGVWDRLVQMGLPANIHLHLTPTAFALEEHAFLLPAPLTRKGESDDIAAWMGDAATPAGALHVGLAHGSVTSFGIDSEATNPIDPARPKSAGLDYLALGDWHRTLQIGPAAWYAGTPEPDRAGGQEQAWPCSSTFRARALPTPVITGTYRWIRRTERLSDHAALADVEQRLRGESDLPRLIARLDLEGSLPIGDYAELQRVSLISRRRFFISTSTSARSSLVRPTPISKPSTSTAFYGDAPTGCVALETIPSALRTCTTAPKRLLWSSTSASRATRPRRLRDAAARSHSDRARQTELSFARVVNG
jgi:DNA repair exonuclease SbcCD nuclease subunit